MALKPPLYVLPVSYPHLCFFLKELGGGDVGGNIAVCCNEVDVSYCGSIALILGAMRQLWKYRPRPLKTVPEAKP